MELFKPAWKSKNREKALKAVEKITDQTKLARIAKEAEYFVRYAAIAKVTDQALLAEIAKNADYSGARGVAVDKLTDQTLLTEIAKNDEDYSVRQVAVCKLTEQSVLAEIAKTDSSTEVSEEAVKKITDQTLLAEIAKNADHHNVREAAIRRLTDQSVLAEIAKNEKYWDTRRVAVDKLTDQSVLAEIAKNDENFFVREAAVDKLTDQSVLAEIAKNDKNITVRYAAVDKLRDQSVLDEIAKNDEESYVCEAAAETLEKLSQNEFKKHYMEFDIEWSAYRLQPYFDKAVAALRSNCDYVSFWWTTRTLYELFIIALADFRNRIPELDGLEKAKQMVSKFLLDRVRYSIKNEEQWRLILESLNALNTEDMSGQYDNAVKFNENWALLVEKMSEYIGLHTSNERTAIAKEAFNLCAGLNYCSVVNMIVEQIVAMMKSIKERETYGNTVRSTSVDFRTGISETSYYPSLKDVEEYGVNIIASLDKTILDECMRCDYSIAPNEAEQYYNYNLLLNKAIKKK